LQFLNRTTLSIFSDPQNKKNNDSPQRTQRKNRKIGILEYWNIDGIVKSRNSIKFVIPAKAGIQLFQDVLDPGFRRGDPSSDFLRDHHYSILPFFFPL